jgi:glucose/arabinose dehydrogenase
MVRAAILKLSEGVCVRARAGVVLGAGVKCFLCCVFLAMVASLAACDDAEPGIAAAAQTSSVLPDGFVEQLVVDGLPDITAMKFAPDGRLFVAQKGGALRIVEAGHLLDAPFLTLDVGTDGERGLAGLAFDPEFATTGLIYIYYTAAVPEGHNRVSRFTADPTNPDRVIEGSEVVLLEIASTNSVFHNGGALTFLADGTLTIAVGDNALGGNAQLLSDLRGKVLRIRSDGSIPTDNPFYLDTTGANRAIWALGFRNPFTSALQPGTGRLFVNDVGQDAMEEIDEVLAGDNHGWPLCEGPCAPPRDGFRDPIAAYSHGFSDTAGCAITGGAFYAPAQPTFPEPYRGRYFYIDFCSDWIRSLDPITHDSALFASGLPPSEDASATQVVLEVGPDGALYFANRFRAAIYRIQYTGSAAPTIGQPPADVSVAEGHPVRFEVRASGAGPLSYAWRRDGTPIGGATQPVLIIPAPTLSDDGARFDCVVSNAVGSATSAAARLVVTANRPPVPVIAQPPDGLRFNAGATIAFHGTASDPEDGALSSGAMTWEVRFHHAEHHHPFLAPQSGISGGAFTIPITGETDPHIWYRILLTAADVNGATTTVIRDIFPNTVNLGLATDPPGLSLLLDGTPVASGFSTQAVVGLQRSLSVARSQVRGEATYVFDHWSDGGTPEHFILTPAADTQFTATFLPLDQLHYNAAFVSQSVPARIHAGERAVVSVTLRNTGLTTWSAANGYRLGSQSPHDGLTWGFNRVDPPGSVAPGGTMTVSFQVRAPQTAGDYAFQWRMLQEGMTWFGAPSPVQTITVEGVPTNDAQIVSEVGPATVAPGAAYTAHVTLLNTGTGTWTAESGYSLGSQSPADNITWGTNRVPLPGRVPPGATVTVDLPLTAPWVTGPVAFQWRMVQEHVEWFGASTTARAVNVVPAGNAAAFVSQAVPPVMLVGQSYDAVVAMKNIGTTTWDPGARFALGSQSPHDGMIWGFHRAFASAPTPPGQTAVFALHLTAPWTPGVHAFQWRMVQDGVEWFGQPSQAMAVNVGVGANAALFVAQSVPSTMNPREQVTVSVTMRNIGAAAWGEQHRLGSAAPRDSFTWGPNRAFLSSPVPPGATATFSFTVTAPSTPGVYSFQWQMLEEAIAWFGPFTDPIQVTVQ